MTVLHLELTAFRDRDGEPRIVLRERGETKTHAGPLAIGRAMTDVNARVRASLDEPKRPLPKPGLDPGKLRAPDAEAPDLGANGDGQALGDLDGHDDQERGRRTVEAGAALEAGVGHDGDGARRLAGEAEDRPETLVGHGAQHAHGSAEGEGA